MLLISIILLLLAPFSFPYGYYTLLKFIVCFTAIREYYLVKNKTIDNSLIWIAIIVLYNTIVRMHLEKPIWTIVNIITAIYFARVLSSQRKEN